MHRNRTTAWTCTKRLEEITKKMEQLKYKPKSFYFYALAMDEVDSEMQMFF